MRLCHKIILPEVNCELLPFLIFTNHFFLQDVPVEVAPQQPLVPVVLPAAACDDYSDDEGFEEDFEEDCEQTLHQNEAALQEYLRSIG